VRSSILFHARLRTQSFFEMINYLKEEAVGVSLEVIGAGLHEKPILHLALQTKRLRTFHKNAHKN
jgi:hypothetical protein